MRAEHTSTHSVTHELRQNLTLPTRAAFTASSRFVGDPPLQWLSLPPTATWLRNLTNCAPLPKAIARIWDVAHEEPEPNQMAPPNDSIPGVALEVVLTK